MMNEVELQKFINTKIELDPVLWAIRETVKFGIKRLMPVLMKMMKDELAEAKREWTAKERQQ